MKWSVVLLVFVNLTASAAEADSSRYDNLTRSDPALLVIGDSLSSGLGIPLGQGWVALLQDRLNEQGLAYRVINASVSGDTTSGGLTRLEKALVKYSPQIVIIELGGNDGLRGLPLKTVEQNLTRMIELNCAAGARTALLGMRIPSNYGPKYTEKFHQLYASLAKRHELPLVDFFMDGVALQPQLMQADGIHPNVKAQSKLLANAWPAIKTAIDSLPVND